ncbi:MAG TPA: hypothetical protein PLO65_02480 [Caulobacter sp.]|nr:hypothetical protein [Caulobacter sp.]
MAELDFEMKLDRMFNEPPVMPDAEAFARLVEMRLDRGWNLRQVAIGSAGLVAGLVGVSQLLGSRLLFDASEATQRNTAAFTSGVSGLVRTGENLSALPFGGEALWLAAALGVMALAFAVTRAVEEFQ